jgi:hypothetical protein
MIEKGKNIKTKKMIAVVVAIGVAAMALIFLFCGELRRSPCG